MRSDCRASRKDPYVLLYGNAAFAYRITRLDFSAAERLVFVRLFSIDIRFNIHVGSLAVDLISKKVGYLSAASMGIFTNYDCRGDCVMRRFVGYV